MYLHLGQNELIKSSSLIGFFDMDKTTVNKNTRKYLNRAEKEKRVKTITTDIPKSFVVASDRKSARDRKKKKIDTVFLTQISSATLKKRTGSLY